LFARYDLDAARSRLVDLSEPGLWRYHAVLPVFDRTHRLYLGEGTTPLIEARRLGERLSLSGLLLKDESRNPTDSFKARGLSVAVAKARELGLTRLAMPTAGNAGGALAAYAAAAGVEAYIVMPIDTPRPIRAECLALAARMELIDGLISDAGRMVREKAAEEGWFNVATFQEPYRVEGKKTMGYELWEQLDGQLPEVIVYPTGGGTGLVGMHKAFRELTEMGLLDSAHTPRFVAVQSSGCAPIVEAFHSGREQCEPWQDAHTVALGLRVPKPLADQLILDALRQSGGTALAVSDDEIRESTEWIGSDEGMFVSPEAAATVAAVPHLLEQGVIDRNSKVALFITASGLKYL
jgi:threonine synthase